MQTLFYKSVFISIGIVSKPKTGEWILIPVWVSLFTGLVFYHQSFPICHQKAGGGVWRSVNWVLFIFLLICEWNRWKLTRQKMVVNVNANVLTDPGKQVQLELVRWKLFCWLTCPKTQRGWDALEGWPNTSSSWEMI